MEKPSALEDQRACWSEYKNHNTTKIASAISPGGAAVYCSDGYPGRVTDTAIRKCADVLTRCAMERRWPLTKGSSKLLTF